MEDLTGVPDGHPGPSLELRVDQGLVMVPGKKDQSDSLFVCAETGLLERMGMARGEPVGYS